MNPVFPHYVWRVRRKLLPADEPPVVVGNVEPVQVNGASRTGVQTTDHGQQTMGPAEAGTTSETDAEAAS